MAQKGFCVLAFEERSKSPSHGPTPSSPSRRRSQSCTRRRAITGEQNESLLHDPAAAQQSRPRRDHAVSEEAPYYGVAPPRRNDEVEDPRFFVLVERARGRGRAGAIAVPEERKSRPRRRVPGVRKTRFFTTAAAVAVSCSRFHDLLHFTVRSSAFASAAAQESGAVGGSTSSSAGTITSTSSPSEQGAATSSNTRHLSAAERLEEEVEQYEPIKGPRMQTGNGGYYRNQFWDMSLVGFSPQTLLSFYLESGSEQHFFHDVEKAPEVFRGGYFLMDESYRGSDSDDNTDFHILDMTVHNSLSSPSFEWHEQQHKQQQTMRLRITNLDADCNPI